MAAPRKYPPANAIEEIERLAAQGYSIIGIAKSLGVSKETFKRWCEEDETLEEAFEVGRETERQALHALIVQSAVMNKPANANAMFLLKARHGYREMDSPYAKVDVNVNTVQPVMIVKDHGDDATWALKAAAQQRALTAIVPEAPQLEAPTAKVIDAVAAPWGPPVYIPTAPTVAPPAPACPAPVWRGRA
jgi:transposase-like protein